MGSQDVPSEMRHLSLDVIAKWERLLKDNPLCDKKRACSELKGALKEYVIKGVQDIDNRYHALRVGLNESATSAGDLPLAKMDEANKIAERFVSISNQIIKNEAKASATHNEAERKRLNDELEREQKALETLQPSFNRSMIQSRVKMSAILSAWQGARWAKRETNRALVKYLRYSIGFHLIYLSLLGVSFLVSWQFDSLGPAVDAALFGLLGVTLGVAKLHLLGILGFVLLQSMAVDRLTDMAREKIYSLFFIRLTCTARNCVENICGAGAVIAKLEHLAMDLQDDE